MFFLPAGLAASTLSQPCTSCPLSGRSGWSNAIETFQDITWESKINQGEPICQSLPHGVKRAASALSSQLRLHRVLTAPSQHPSAHTDLGMTPLREQGGCSARSGGCTASFSSHCAHKAKAAPPTCFAFASPEQSQGSCTSWSSHIKAGVWKKSSFFPLTVKLDTVQWKRLQNMFYMEKCFTPGKC